MTSHRLAPQTGTAFTLCRGQMLRIIDPEGKQVADLTAFGLTDDGNRRSWLSSGRTFDYNNTVCLSTGHVLYSNRSARMFSIVEDRVGRHDFLYTPCSAEMFRMLYGVSGYHPSCHDNLANALASYGIMPDDISTTFNVFMNVDIGDNGRLRILPPKSKPGDYISLRAEMDLIVGLTACSAELSNHGELKPIDYEIHRSVPS